MDGHFVPNLTVGPAVVKSLRPHTPLFLDCHLMVENPDRWIEPFHSAGADGLTLHIETLTEPAKTLKKVRDLGMKVGLTLKPQTALERLVPWLSWVDLVLVMTVDPGYSGQKMLPEQINKISLLREHFRALSCHPLIEVDGGVNCETVAHLQQADVLVAGNFVFKSPDYGAAIAELKNSGGPT